MLPTINPKEETARIISFIKASLRKCRFSRIVIGCSGGLDSSISLTLSVKTLGKDNVFPLLLPYGKLNLQGTRDALTLINKLGIDSHQIETIDITPAVGSFEKMMAINLNQESPQKQSIRLGNIMARCRMIIVYDRAKKHEALVMGTENKSEHFLGYFTRFGDEASDIEPIRHLYKTQVYEIARFLNIPKQIITKAPTAGLWPGQTDEKQFGFSYKNADQILYALYEQKKTVPEVIQLGFSPEEVTRVKVWVEANHFKHDLPVVLAT